MDYAPDDGEYESIEMMYLPVNPKNEYRSNRQVSNSSISDIEDISLDNSVKESNVNYETNYSSTTTNYAPTRQEIIQKERLEMFKKQKAEMDEYNKKMEAEEFAREFKIYSQQKANMNKEILDKQKEIDKQIEKQEEIRKQEELAKLIDASKIKAPPKREFVPDPSKYEIYYDINIGNNQPYIIEKTKLTHMQKTNMEYKAIRQLIQIFIELRNSLGYTSLPPHSFNICQLNQGVLLLQKEYVERYLFQFGYDYNLFQIDLNKPYISKSFNQLHNERNKYFSSVEPIINFPSPPPCPQTIDESGPCFTNKLDYTPLPQRKSRGRIRATTDMEYPKCKESNLVVHKMSRIYGNKYVNRKKKKNNFKRIFDTPF